MTAPPSETRDDRRILPVGALLVGINGLLEDRVGRVWVLGEVSNLHRAVSGHSYFTLKDDRGQIRAALFRSAASRVRFELEEGMEVVLQADVSVYAARGDLQLIVRQIEPRGQGALQLAFEQLRRRLASEGLFDEERKRALPEFPRRVGVVTSPTSAALRDVIQVSGAQFPMLPILISPTRVQGEGAEHEIVAAIRALEVQPEIDVILVVRGGGSLEDLWSFNSEEVARAIAACPVPVVSGVGHETDFTIADGVADARAPTPSAAAMIALPDVETLAIRLDRDIRQMVAAVRAGVGDARQRLRRERDALRVLAPTARVRAQRSRLLAGTRALGRAGHAIPEIRRSRLAHQVGRLDSLSPLAVLARGYALVRRSDDGVIPRRADELAPGDRLTIRLAEAEVEATVDSLREADRSPEEAAKREAKAER